ncbi:MAG: hypothetical protein Q8M94_20960, partial [Ignavibacteria bacterium]|nr:hypothetical protein [Ignavibacteria bacterium]
MKTLVIFFSLVFLSTPIIRADNCITCHKKLTPNIVSDWQISKHSANDVTCSTCHGSDHNSASTVDDGLFICLENNHPSSTEGKVILNIVPFGLL